MTYRGQVRNGVVVLQGAVELPEGAEVAVEVLKPAPASTPADSAGPTLGEKLLRYAGKGVDLPPDLARNHDHYLYGTPKDDS